MKISSCTPSNEESYTEKYQKHEPSGFCYYIKYVHGDYKDPVLYRGPDAAKKFIEMIRKETDEIYKIYTNTTDMLPLTNTETTEFDNAKRC